MRVRKIVIFIVLVLFLFVGLHFTKLRNTIEPNGEVVYNHVNLIINEEDWYQNVGYADYVFMATVENIIPHDTTSSSPVTLLELSNNENLKGKLTNNLTATLNSGYSSDGTLVLNATDTTLEEGLPKIGVEYIFIAYAQPDDSILIAPIIGFKEANAETREKYIRYVLDEIPIDRVRYSSSYELK